MIRRPGDLRCKLYVGVHWVHEPGVVLRAVVSILLLLLETAEHLPSWQHFPSFVKGLQIQDRCYFGEPGEARLSGRWHKTADANQVPGTGDWNEIKWPTNWKGRQRVWPLVVQPAGGKRGAGGSKLK